ncbi:exonuclease SbcCD subunit D [Klugiella xanthotipulae]|uniref:Nuclease SbcCD subunit D n=1 Tax=Klugiella xanthotipulae TaxID=244735 RepID=A0A543HYB1_9MICO|nr:exonuclease SbcCD subunit D [Klugiella xanthotipulae]TQM63332.1 exodeoxyribonuclease I subunit D [Klugiella xanthotipulae]
MKLLHTSDWHIGRTFHGHPTLDALRVVLADLVQQTRERGVDVVLVSGDVFDSAMPAAEHFTLLTETLTALRATGARVIVTSGNHDSAARLGFQASLLAASGVHMMTNPEAFLTPVIVPDTDGPVAFYGIPYLEPALFRHRHPGERLARHDDVLGFVLDRIRADAARRGGRYVVLSHCFAAGLDASVGTPVDAPADSPGVERDITAGGIDYVSRDRFLGPDYVALGHIHGRAVLADGIRYSGAPLHYAFSEAKKPRGAWLVTLDADGLAGTEWLTLPVPRQLTVLTGEIDHLLADPALAGHENDWVCAILTDTVRPLDPMSRLQKRFPGCATLEHRPTIVVEDDGERYAARVRSKTDPEIVAAFLSHVRNGRGPSSQETGLIAEAWGELDAGEPR